MAAPAFLQLICFMGFMVNSAFTFSDKLPLLAHVMRLRDKQKERGKKRD